LVDDFYQRFVVLVKRSRPNISTDVFSEVVDGRVYSGEAALAVGLVDAVGDLYDAFEHAKKLAQIERAELVMYHRPANPVRSPHAAVPPIPAGGTQINLAQINLGPSLTGTNVNFLYLWQPD
jgi:ClpP class serine protease